MSNALVSRWPVQRYPLGSRVRLTRDCSTVPAGFSKGRDYTVTDVHPVHTDQGVIGYRYSLDWCSSFDEDMLEVGGETVTKSRETANQRVDEMLKRIKETTLKPNQLIEEVKNLPAELAVAFMAGRPEMVKAVPPRALTKDECSDIYNFVGVLIATNQALQDHAQQVSKLVAAWMQALIGLQTTANRIEHFANFRYISPEDEDDLELQRIEDESARAAKE